MKVAVVTGARSEYGIFKPILRGLCDEYFDLNIVAHGTHFLKSYGNTIDEIKSDSFGEVIEIETFSEDSSKSYELTSTIDKLHDHFKSNYYDVVFIIGDRLESYGAALAAHFLKIPIIHFYGGETSEGSFDNIIRDQISLMSEYHFVSSDLHKKKLKKLGIKKNIFNIGVLAFDKIKSYKLFNKKYLKKKLKINFENKTALVTFHPITTNQKTGQRELVNLLKALKKIPNLEVIFTGPNNDPGSQFIISKIKKLCFENPKKFKFYSHLGPRLYHSLVSNVDFNIGNSSSLLYEVPFFGKYSFNIGLRQQGRLAGKSVINIRGDYKQIYKVIKKYYNKKIRKKIKNPFFKKNSTRRTLNYFSKFFFM